MSAHFSFRFTSWHFMLASSCSNWIYVLPVCNHIDLWQTPFKEQNNRTKKNVCTRGRKRGHIIRCMSNKNDEEPAFGMTWANNAANTKCDLSSILHSQLHSIWFFIKIQLDIASCFIDCMSCFPLLSNFIR